MGCHPLPLYQQNFYSQERWLLQASSESEPIESILEIGPLQNGELRDDERSAEVRRLDGFSRSERCLPVVFGVKKHRKYL